MKLGVTVGKFYPFHSGHSFLIETAKSQVDHLVVLVAHKPSQEISGAIRAAWIREVHPDVEVIKVLDDIPDASEPWAQRTLEILDPRRPDVVFTSEDYGTNYASLMNCEHSSVDAARSKFPISGTTIRGDLGKHWAHLTPPAKAYFAKRVCVIGVESSGTTTMARALAEHYQTVWVPEYGRCYWEGRQFTPNSGRWETNEFVRIAERQSQCEDDLARLANRLVICDTDPMATHVWHRRFKGNYSSEVGSIAERQTYQLYLLTEPDFEFVQDGTREGESIRGEMHTWFLKALESTGTPIVRLSGPHDERMRTATNTVDSLLAFEELEAP